MAKADLPSPDELRQLLRYEPDTGKLFWLPRPVEMFFDSKGRITAARRQMLWNGRYAGREAFPYTHTTGYRPSRVLGVSAKAHVVAWALMTGRWPDHIIDHINGDPADNRWSNLRAATAVQNMFNRKPKTDGASRFKGVYWHRKRQRWFASIRENGRLRHIGYFTDEVAAARAYDAAALVLQGEFARLNIS